MRRCSARRNSALARAHSSGFTGGLLSQQRMPGEAQRRVRRQTGAPQLRGSPSDGADFPYHGVAEHIDVLRRPVIIRPVGCQRLAARARVAALGHRSLRLWHVDLLSDGDGAGRTAGAASRCRAAKCRRIARPLFPQSPQGPWGFSFAPSKREAERRKAPLSCPASARPALAGRRTSAGAPSAESASPFGAPPRRFWASGPCFRDSDGRLFASPIAGLSPRSSCPVQPLRGSPP